MKRESWLTLEAWLPLLWAQFTLTLSHATGVLHPRNGLMSFPHSAYGWCQVKGEDGWGLLKKRNEELWTHPEVLRDPV